MMFDLFGLTIHGFGLCLTIAGAIALALAARNFRLAGIRQGALSWFALLSIPLMVILGRLAFCLASLDWVSQEGWAFAFDLSRGGYMLYGALLGAVIALVITSRLSNVSFARMADNLAVPALVLVALGRLAIGLTCQQDYGWGVEDWFTEGSGMSFVTWEDPSLLYRFPFAIKDYYGGYNWAVFVYEALVAVTLAIIADRIRIRRDGGRAVLALTCYAAMQILCESLRQDAVLRWGFVRINQVVGALLVLALLIHCYRLSGIRKPGQLTLGIVSLVLCAFVIMTMEFALEQKIGFLQWMPMDLCYTLMCASCVGMILTVKAMWKKAYT